jgi:hypothetical protein
MVGFVLVMVFFDHFVWENVPVDNQNLEQNIFLRVTMRNNVGESIGSPKLGGTLSLSVSAVVTCLGYQWIMDSGVHHECPKGKSRWREWLDKLHRSAA